MPAILANARDFLVTSDYPMDKIIYLKSGSVPIDGYPHSISHNLPFTPLVGGYWSMTPDFSVCYEFSSGDFPSGNLGYIFGHSVDIECDSETTIDLYTRDIAGGSKTCYYRIFAFEPSNVNADISSPVSLSDEMVFNTDYNYMKLYMSGVVNPGTATTYSITHGMGYKPRVMAWHNQFGYVTPIVRAGDTAGGDPCIIVDDEKITLNNRYGIPITQFHYRIYLDD